MRERALRRDGRRLLARKSRFDSLVDDLYLTGVRCDCCPGFWRFEASPRVRAGFDVERRKFDWLWKRHPRLLEQLSEREAERYQRTGVEDDGWWNRVREQLSPKIEPVAQIAPRAAQGHWGLHARPDSSEAWLG